MRLSLLDDALRSYIAAKRVVIACHCESFALQSFIPCPLCLSVNSASSHSHSILRVTALYKLSAKPTSGDQPTVSAAASAGARIGRRMRSIQEDVDAGPGAELQPAAALQLECDG